MERFCTERERERERMVVRESIWREREIGDQGEGEGSAVND